MKIDPRRDPRTMLPVERAVEVRWWLKTTREINVNFMWSRLNTLLGRNIFEHEFAHPEDLIEEALRDYPATLREIAARWHKHYPLKPFVMAVTPGTNVDVIREQLDGVLATSLDEAIAWAQAGELRPIVVEIDPAQM